MNKHITIDKLWLEFKKAIDYGNWTKFKTRRGFDSFLKRKAMACPGKMLRFCFQDIYGYKEFLILVEDIIGSRSK